MELNEITRSSRAEVWEMYSQGKTLIETMKATRLDYNYIDDLFCEWSIEKARQKAIEDKAMRYNEDTPTMRIEFNRKVSDFALHSTDPEVWKAFNQMINPKKK